MKVFDIFETAKYSLAIKLHESENIIMTKNTMQRTIVIAVLCLLSAINIADTASREYRWGTDTKSVYTHYVKNSPNFEFSVSRMPSYKNKIMNYILAIDSSLKDRITIIRASSDPVKDYLFVNKKLYSVLEYHGKISNNSLNTIIKNLSSVYKNPTIQQDKKLTVYSFMGAKTKVITLARKNKNAIECKTYFYAGNLFRMLLSN